MFMPRDALDPRSTSNQPTSTQCKLLIANSKICAGDIVIGVGCASAIILLSTWAIRAWRKRYRPATPAAALDHQGNTVLDPYHVVVPFNDSLLVKHGVVYPPTIPERARTTDVFWSPATSQHDGDVPFKLTPPGLSTSPPGPPVTMTVMVLGLDSDGKEKKRVVSSLGQIDDSRLSCHLRRDVGLWATPSPRSSWVRGEVVLLQKGMFEEGEGESERGTEDEFESENKEASPCEMKFATLRASVVLHDQGA